jgi:hypothetical protein
MPEFGIGTLFFGSGFSVTIVVVKIIKAATLFYDRH